MQALAVGHTKGLGRGGESSTNYPLPPWSSHSADVYLAIQYNLNSNKSI